MDEPSFWAFQAKDWLNTLILAVTCFAVYYGPIKAVSAARQQEAAAQKTKRKFEIFASLMKTRRFQLDPEHVASLNLIQVYFADHGAVLKTYREYIKLLSRKAIPGVADESLWKERDDAFIDLVHEIAKSIGFQYDKKDLVELSYGPQGWANDQDTVRKLHALLVDVLEHRRALPVAPFLNAQNSPFPPQPLPPSSDGNSGV